MELYFPITVKYISKHGQHSHTFFLKKILPTVLLPGVLLLIVAVVPGKMGVTTGGGIPAAISSRG